jgi:pimeloyl-ACP methyl ester carboxylesterase
VVILIHGLGDEADTWRHLFPPLTAAGYRALAPDLPGFGRSPAAGGGLNAYRDAVLELAGTVCEQKPEQAAGTESPAGKAGPGIVLVGSSMGAAVAEAAAFKRPGGIRGLVLADGCIPAAAALSPGLLSMALPFAGRGAYRFFRNNPEAAWRSLAPYYGDLAALPGEDQDFLRRRVMDRVNSPSQERAYFSSLRSMIFHNLFLAPYYKSKLKNPPAMQLLWGEKDRILPSSTAEQFRALCGAELAVIPGAGHLPQQERPAETAEAVIAFLRKIPPPA